MLDKVLYRSSIVNPINSYKCDFYEDGGLYVENGMVANLGHFDDIISAYCDVELQELEGVIVPGFTDAHLHWVQHRVSGHYSGELLKWLQDYIWPEEGLFIDDDLAMSTAAKFYSDLLRAGTVMGMSYSSTHASATKIALKKMRGDWIVGNVLMSINAPNFLTDFSLHDPYILQGFMDEIDIEHYAITPRFAPNLSAASLKALGDIALWSNAIIQTHLAESCAELVWVRELFPDAANYTEVYDRAGLLTKRTILGHCIELSDSEWHCLATRGCWVAHCPSSNEALGNHRMPLEKLREFNVPYALGSDIGAGPSHSMLHVLQRFFMVHRAAAVPITFVEAIYRATLAGAEAMGRGSIAGNFSFGKRADFILLPKLNSTDSWEMWFENCISGSISDLEKRPLGTWLSGKRVTN